MIVAEKEIRLAHCARRRVPANSRANRRQTELGLLPDLRTSLTVDTPYGVARNPALD